MDIAPGRLNAWAEGRLEELEEPSPVPVNTAGDGGEEVALGDVPVYGMECKSPVSRHE